MADTKMSDKKLAFGYWWVTHRPTLRKGWGFVLLIVNLIIIANLVVNLVFYIMEVMQTSRLAEQLQSQSTSLISIRQSNIPQSLKVGKAQVFPSDLSGRINVAAEIINPNASWGVENFTYSFIVNGEILPAKNEFMAPGERYFLMAFGIESNTLSEDQVQASIVLSDVMWKRTNAKTMPETSIEIEDVDFLPSIRIEETENVFSQVNADIRNHSVVGFEEVEFAIILELEGNVIAARHATLKDVLSDETRKLRVQWSRRIASQAKVTILPHVNNIDTNNIILP